VALCSIYHLIGEVNPFEPDYSEVEPGGQPRRSGVMPEENKPRTARKPGFHRLALAARSIQNNFTGHVSKTVLLTRLLPLSVASFFGTLIVAALVIPTGYDWRVRVISKLTSPRDNPECWWLPSLGIMAAMLLALPFAGYVGQRLHATTPRLARSAGLAFAFGFVLLLLAVVAQLAQPVIGLRRLHQVLAGASAGGFILGMLCCCLCAVKDRLRQSGKQRSLPASLAFFWVSLTLLPIGAGAGIGILMLLGHIAGQTWAEDLRQSFRPTLLWHLAFWEWIGVVVAFAFLLGSVLLLPVSRPRERRSKAGRNRLTLPRTIEGISQLNTFKTEPRAEASKL
jgi:hypothetical protein